MSAALLWAAAAQATDHRVAMMIDERFGVETTEIEEQILKSFPNAVRYQPGVASHFLAVMAYRTVEDKYECTLNFICLTSAPMGQIRPIAYGFGEPADWLGAKKIGHVRGAPYHPQTQGKIERWHKRLGNFANPLTNT